MENDLLARAEELLAKRDSKEISEELSLIDEAKQPPLFSQTPNGHPDIFAANRRNVYRRREPIEGLFDYKP